MNEPSVNLDDALALAALADGIIPADERDAGAASVHAGPIIAERIGALSPGPSSESGCYPDFDQAQGPTTRSRQNSAKSRFAH